MADFILLAKINVSGIDSSDRELTALLSENEIVTACTKFGAEIKKFIMPTIYL